MGKRGKAPPMWAWALLLAAMLLAPAGASAAEDALPAPFTAKVFRVYDGDTLLVRTRDRTQRVHLYGIDAPENRQTYGRNARRVLEKMAGGKRVEITPLQAADDQGEWIGRVTLGERDLSVEMLLAGMAWALPEGEHSAAFSAHELAAREARRGLWAGLSGTPPWEWRAQQ